MKRDRARSGLLALAICATLGASGAMPSAAAPARGDAAQDVEALRVRLDAFSRKLHSLRRDAARKEAELRLVAEDLPPTLAAQYQVRLSQLERSIRDLTGKVEDLAYQVRELQKDQKNFRNDVEFRLQELEKGKTASRAAPERRRDAPAPRSSTARRETRETAPGTATLPAGSAAEQYRFAMELLRKAQYSEANAAFRQFIRRHPNHSLTGNAHYWLGEVQYVQGRYKDAAILFADGYQKFPKHAKAPDILLKLSMTMARLNKNQEACAALSELRRRFPNAGGHIQRAADSERRQLGCSG